ncbi:hypothetical protein LEP1GSC016_2877 [Leptospira borgpetersenii serovar Hardjo-bovis str. Sponselee]|uniref:Uncharacterized protein n=3 Tax=Leptospira borgpetersenii TaxID=174 RepID=A0A0S2IVB2_LEPBO|nr:hypothetical protein LBBP_03364 [Leptospira borgpetersenii serovar Ballum]EMJ84191.1 hypothetical protein LEP1GSC016_2877 [Leptospira borgpetersenii serovar Hardjo-bovis str. Sponselee]EMO09287.1 hypothetical protein LEP1GSC137_2712 [Leptospira borgpetersenii str. Noumea 25]EMO62196.1 hypothetical protein LEP1GSC133_4962 [Leptospira borgpetersenii serovar Pomona str. 200901868]
MSQNFGRNVISIFSESEGVIFRKLMMSFCSSKLFQQL